MPSDEGRSPEEVEQDEDEPEKGGNRQYTTTPPHNKYKTLHPRTHATHPPHAPKLKTPLPRSFKPKGPQFLRARFQTKRGPII